jgi:hypothetical protein
MHYDELAAYLVMKNLLLTAFSYNENTIKVCLKQKKLFILEKKSSF